MYSGSPELPEGPPAVRNYVVAEASPHPAQPAEVLDLTTMAASDRGQKRTRLRQPGTSLLTWYFRVTSKKLSTVVEGPTRPGARVVAGTAAAARNGAQKRQALAQLQAAPTTLMSGVCVIEVLKYLLAHGPLALRDCFVNLGSAPVEAVACAPTPMQPTPMQAATILLPGTPYGDPNLFSVCCRTNLNQSKSPWLKHCACKNRLIFQIPIAQITE
eukprot:352544-Chlamydomonas_euryale.AAC.1